MMTSVLDMIILLGLAVGVGTLFLVMTMHQEQMKERQDKNRMEWI